MTCGPNFRNYDCEQTSPGCCSDFQIATVPIVRLSVHYKQTSKGIRFPEMVGILSEEILPTYGGMSTTFRVRNPNTLCIRARSQKTACGTPVALMLFRKRG